MVKPLNEFGGWLTVFFVTLWINAVSCVISGIALLILFFKSSDMFHAVDPILLFVRFIAVCIIFCNIIRIVKKKEATIPGEIFSLMSLNLWISLAVYLLVVLWDYFALGIGPTDIFLKYGRIISSIIAWYFLWKKYLKRSKRVLAYYGENL